ncbi:hypothetical protein [Saccharomonospora azurea]|uniref:hypothetical protein n=1 Tax=Saccharomonospora azurea TaxID=40988 RepID=UPI001146D563|nr:hypothetical protein [Saccharomonospora azurea]
MDVAAVATNKGDALTDRPRDRVYHGINGNAEGAETRILVVQGGGGPTERHRGVTVLYELSPEFPFWWGYTGGSPGRTATAIIEDVTPDLVADEPALEGLLNSSLRSDLIIAFLVDVVGHLHDSEEFWLSAQSVIRWVRGYYRELMTS